MSRKSLRGAAPIIHDDIGFDLDRLFDRYNMDHIPVKNRLEGFAQRDLPHVKHYKAAVNIFGGPLSRKRVIIAPPMETPLKRKLGLYMNQHEDPPPPVLNSELKPSTLLSTVMSSSEVLEEEEKERDLSYKKWFQERQGLRANLEGMGLSEALMQRKADKSELEKRVENQLRAARLWKPESPLPPEPVPEEKEPPVVPSMKVPVPTAMQTLNTFLTEKKIRLIDLFRKADTNHDWKLNKKELLAAVKKYQIPLTGSDVEDLMVTLDHNFDEQLDFKEVSQGLAALKMERRAHGHQDNTPTIASSTAGKANAAVSLNLNFNQNRNDSGVESCEKVSDSERGRPGDYTFEDIGVTLALGQKKTRAKSAASSAASSQTHSAPDSYSSSTPQSHCSSTRSLLEPPPPDLREERCRASSSEDMLELRKHDKAVLERSRQKKWPWPSKRGTHGEMPGVIRIGHKEVDNHCMESTLEGEVGELMNHFRRSCLKEYFHAVRLCQEKGIILTPELLDRVLLYPPEIPKQQLMKKLALPKGPLAGLEGNFVQLTKKPQTPPEILHKGKIKRSRNGSLMIDSRHMYPPASQVAPVTTKENLSTGRALVARRSDIWMSFEEYDQYTKQYRASWHWGQSSPSFDLPTKWRRVATNAVLPEGYRQHRASWHGGQPSPAFDLQTKWPRVAANAVLPEGQLPRHYKKLNAADGPRSQDSNTTITSYTRSLSSSSSQRRRYKGYHLDEEKFWPGYMLHKLALYEPGPDCPAPWERGGMALFHHTRQPTKRGNMGHVRFTGPPVHQDGRILQYGIDWQHLV